MAYKMFIDDERNPVTDDYVIVRSSHQAIDYVKKHGSPSYISFDHDLGGTDTSMVFINKWVDMLIDNVVDFPAEFDYYVHSQNPVGAANIRGYVNQIINMFGDRK
jgi:hypothetical protein